MAQISLVSALVCLVAQLIVASSGNIICQSNAKGSMVALQAIGTLQQSGMFERTMSYCDEFPMLKLEMEKSLILQ